MSLRAVPKRLARRACVWPAGLYAILVDHGLADPDAFAHAMLDLEGTEAAPVVEADERGALLRLGGTHGAFLEAWLEARSRLEAGEMSREEYERWRDSYIVADGIEG